VRVGLLLDLLLPLRCVVCGDPPRAVCERCLGRLRRLAGPHCERCGAPTAWPVPRCNECQSRRLAFASARAAVAYDIGAKALVSAWKERGLRGLAGDAGALVAEVVPRPSAYTITFVPPDADRALERGHHPAEMLARELERHWQLPTLPLLERARRGRRQRGLGLADRRSNVRGAFRAVARAPSRLVLVDDVYTSGATAAAAASALRQAGARRVDVITFARAVR
jgi:predicted amidophosphoribosyltransferase